MVRLCGVFALFFVGLLTYAAGDENAIYIDVIPANTSESLIKVSNAPINVYSFKYDSVYGRRQMGILGVDAQRWFPDSVEVVPAHPISTKLPGQKHMILKNFPIVNKNVVFMHGLAALQELIRKHALMDGAIDSLRHSGSDHQMVFAEIERRLAKEADEQLAERRRLAEAEEQLAAQEMRLETVKVEEEAKPPSKRVVVLLFFEARCCHRRATFSSYSPTLCRLRLHHRCRHHPLSWCQPSPSLR